MQKGYEVPYLTFGLEREYLEILLQEHLEHSNAPVQDGKFYNICLSFMNMHVAAIAWKLLIDKPPPPLSMISVTS